MDPNDKQELISAYWDGELTGPERAEAESLLESSPEFRRDLDDYARLSDLIRGLPNETAPVELAAAVRRQAEEQSLLVPTAPLPKRSLRREWLAAFTGMAVTAAAVLVMVQTKELSLGQNSEISSEGVAGSPMTVASGETSSESSDRARFHTQPVVPGMVATKESGPRDSFLDESKLPAAQPDVAAAEAASPHMLGIVSNDRSDDDGDGVLNGVRIGNVLQYLEQRGDNVAVVELQVVDVTRSLGQLEVLLKEQQVEVLPADIARNWNMPIENSEAPPPRSAKDEGQLTTVFLEASSDQVDQLFSEMSRRKLFVQANLQAPVNVAPNTAAEPLDVKPADEPAAKHESEQLVRNDADEAARQYASRNRVSQNVAGTQDSKLSEESLSASRSKRTKFSLGRPSRETKAPDASNKSIVAGQKLQPREKQDVAAPPLKQNLAYINQQAVPKEAVPATEPSPPAAPVDVDGDAPERTVRMLMVLIPQQIPPAAGPQ